MAWYRAFRQHERSVPLWRIHRHIGMGGDQLVPALVGEDFEREQGDELRAAETALYLATIEEVGALPVARRLIEALKAGDGRTVVLSSSAKENELDHYLDRLDLRELVDGWTTSADVEQTKPAPDVVEVALEKAGGKPAVMVGDSPWDCQAASRAGIETVAVLTGGFCAGELREAGACAVFESADELANRLAETPLGA